MVLTRASTCQQKQGGQGMPKITKRVVDAAAPDSVRRFIVWDDLLPGFGLLVLPTGVKSYLHRYRNADGIERRATIGKHGSLTAEEARRLADGMRALVKAGRDPLAEKRERRKALTVGDMLDAYLSSAHYLSKASSTQGTDKGRINRHLKPLLGKVHIESLRPEAIERASNAIRDGRTATTEKVGPRAVARVRGGAGTARKAIRLLKSVLGWALREGIVKSNPAAGLKTSVDGARDLILDNTEAYQRLFSKLGEMEAAGTIRRPVADAVRTIALTGARRGEIAGLRWRHVDLKAGLVKLPISEHKSGKSTGKERVIGLPAEAQALIARQLAGKPDDFVFAPAHGTGPLNLTKPWTAIRVAAKLPAGIGLHGTPPFACVAHGDARRAGVGNHDRNGPSVYGDVAEIRPLEPGRPAGGSAEGCIGSARRHGCDRDRAGRGGLTEECAPWSLSTRSEPPSPVPSVAPTRPMSGRRSGPMQPAG